MGDQRCAAAPVLVIGYGNTMRGDDGLGPWVANWLGQDPTLPVEVIVCQQLTIDLAEPISRAGAVVLVDAARGLEPGAIAHCSVTPQGDKPQSMLHHMKPAALLVAAQALYGAAPSTTLWTVTGQQFEYGDGFSSAVEQALPALLDQLTDFIRHTKEEAVF